MSGQYTIVSYRELSFSYKVTVTVTNLPLTPNAMNNESTFDAMSDQRGLKGPETLTSNSSGTSFVDNL